MNRTTTDHDEHDEPARGAGMALPGAESLTAEDDFTRAIRGASELGRIAGSNAAQWVFDGSTTEASYRAFLRGIEDGDPMVMDAYRAPDLSGEWAGDPTPRSLAWELDIDPDDSDALSEACSAWEDAASETFWGELESIARRHVPPDIFTRRRDALAYLTADGNLRVPCSRYGRDSETCAPIAWQVARIIAREQGEPVTRESLDHVMGLVVNDHDDIAYMVNTYGHGHYER